MSCSTIATILDQEMLEKQGIVISARLTPNEQLAKKSGEEVAKDLGGRYLLRYVMTQQLGAYTNGSNQQHFVTPTPYSPGEAISWLALPKASDERLFTMLLDPKTIPTVWGPRWVRGGKGFEYFLPHGFPSGALVYAWELKIS